MFSSNQKITEINALKELRNNAQKLNNQEKHLEALLAKQSTLKNRISASRNRTYGSPSNFYEQYMNELKQKRALANERKEKNRHIIFCVLLFLLCAALVFTVIHFRSEIPVELFTDNVQEMTEEDYQHYVITLIAFVCVFCAYMLFFSLVGLYRCPSFIENHGWQGWWFISWIFYGYIWSLGCFGISIAILFCSWVTRPTFTPGSSSITKRVTRGPTTARITRPATLKLSSTD